MFRITTHTRSAGAAAAAVVQLVSVEWIFYSPIKERGKKIKTRRGKCASHPAVAIFPYRDAD